MTRESPYLTTAEAADYLRYRSTSGVRSAVQRGELKPCGVGPKNTLLFTRQELDRFVSARMRRYRSPDHEMPGEQKGRLDEKIRKTNQVPRSAQNRTENLPSTRHTRRPANRQTKGDRQSSKKRDAAASRAQTSRVTQHEATNGRGPGKSAAARWGIRSIVDSLESHQDRRKLRGMRMHLTCIFCRPWVISTTIS